MLRHRGTAIVSTICLLLGGFVAGGHTGTAAGKVVTIAGSLQDELGCATDWDPACTATQLPATGADTYSAQFAVPAGSWEFKITIGGSWDENYGLGGVPGGSNIPLVIAGPAALRFTYDDTTHATTVSPTDLPSGIGRGDRALAGDSLRNLLTREQFYFVMTDRFANGDPTNDTGGYAGGRLTTGYDPADKGFYHGGDLRGLIGKLDYIKALGTTAIWLTPSFVNKPVQGPAGQESAGYHGYWITDFTHIDPHLGTNNDLKEMITKAHDKGMKVFFDIITNHTADVIDNTERQYSYRNKTTYPYKDAAGNVFDDRDFVNSPDFPALNAASFPYTPVFDNPAVDATAKTPAWLNDVTVYHNRGDSTFAGESAEYGDFSGLDDLFTEQLRVEQGMEDIYKAWIDLGIDGFRIDTAKHVNVGFWQKFAPAMLEHAADVGTPKFFMFGEVFDANPAFQSIYSTAAKLPTTLDFGFQQNAVAVTNGKGTSLLADLYAGDDYYTDTDSNAYNLPTFLGNHDMGRIGNFVGGSLRKDLFANALMFTLRGQPVVYYGDEQGFIGDGGDKDARQDMFASQVASYNDDPMVAGPTGSMDRYGTDGTVFQALAGLSELRKANPALEDGAQITRFASDSPGIFAASRIDAAKNVEYLVVANSADTEQTATFPTYTDHGKFRSIYGGGSKVSVGDENQVTITVPPLTVRVFKADQPIKRSLAAPPAFFVTPGAGGVLSGRTEIRAMVPGNDFLQVSYAFRPVGTAQWQPLGTDDNAPYRVFQDVGAMAKGTLLEYRVVVKDDAGHLSAASAYGVVGDPPPTTGGGGVGDVEQPASVTVAGTLDSELGCAADWQQDCALAHMTLDPNDEIWKAKFTLPAGTYSYKVAINDSWSENYGANAARDGANIDVTSTGAPITFYYDHRTHFVTSDAQTQIVTAPGSFQSEMGCLSGGNEADWLPECMKSWLQDIDGDGVATLSTTQIPAGTYEGKAAVGLSWDENYGAGGVPNGPNIPFTVPADGLVTTFAFDMTTHVLTISVAAAKPPPDLSVTDAKWLDGATIGYPLARLPAGVDPAALSFRLHWGALAVDATSLGGTSAGLAVVGGAPDGYVALRLDKATARQRAAILASPMVAVGVYDDAHRVVDATGVAPP